MNKIIALVIFLINISLVLTQWSSSPIINTPVCTGINNDVNQVIASDGFGGALIAWEDYRSGNKIYVQKINSSGVSEWTPNGLAVKYSGYQTSPQITDDASGGAIVVFMEVSGYGQIFVQKIAADGTFPWGVNGIRILSSYNGYKPQIISDNSGGAYVVWQDYRWGTSDIDIYAQRINSDGTVLWSADGIPVCQPTGNQTDPQLKRGSGIIFTWSDYRNSTLPDIYAQKISILGVPQWAADGVVVCDVWLDNKYYPQIYTDPLFGGSVISWVDDRRNPTKDIYIQKLDNSGNRLWSTIGVRVSYSDWQKELNFPAHISSDGAGGAYVTWSMSNGTNYDIYAQRISSGGSAMWGSNGLAVCTASGNQTSPEIVTSWYGNAIITWKDERNYFDIYTQSIGLSGNILWTGNGVVICNEPSIQNNVKLCADINGGAIICWQDSRNGGTEPYDIYTSRVTSSGILLPVDISFFGYEQDKNNVTLHWKTNSETNNAGFFVQRVQTGTNNWLTAGNITGYGTTNEPKEYSFQDYRLSSAKYNYRLKQYDYNGDYEYFPMSGDVLVGIPSQSNLAQNYPNPFNPSTNIEFQIPFDAHITLKLYDVTGRLIDIIQDENKMAGYFGIEYRPVNLPSGVYFYQLVAQGTTDKFIMTKKMTLIK